MTATIAQTMTDEERRQRRPLLRRRLDEARAAYDAASAPVESLWREQRSIVKRPEPRSSRQHVLNRIVKQRIEAGAFGAELLAPLTEEERADLLADAELPELFGMVRGVLEDRLSTALGPFTQAARRLLEVGFEANRLELEEHLATEQAVRAEAYRESQDVRDKLPHGGVLDPAWRSPALTRWERRKAQLEERRETMREAFKRWRSLNIAEPEGREWAARTAGSRIVPDDLLPEEVEAP